MKIDSFLKADTAKPLIPGSLSSVIEKLTIRGAFQTYKKTNCSLMCKSN